MFRRLRDRRWSQALRRQMGRGWWCRSIEIRTADIFSLAGSASLSKFGRNPSVTHRFRHAKRAQIFVTYMKMRAKLPSLAFAKIRFPQRLGLDENDHECKQHQ